MENIRDLYRVCKKKPIIGTILISLRALYKNSILEKRRLYKKDYSKALEVLKEMFPESDVVRQYLTEIVSSDIFKTKYSYGHSGDFDIIFLYVLARITRPEIVLETGVASGRSSAAILSALDKNNKGKLHSIDLPQYYTTTPELYMTDEGNNELTGFVPEGKTPGWIVPDSLRSRWNLVLGDSKVELPKLLEVIGGIDIFYHDSDHSEKHMNFEFDSVYPNIANEGFVLSDDVSWNDAWKNFVRKHSVDEVCVYRNFGISRK